MTDKELRKLSRAELIDILFELQTQNENLTAVNRELAAQLESRQLQITEAGSIAEAALRHQRLSLRPRRPRRTNMCAARRTL